MMLVAPIAHLEAIELDDLNRALTAWGHKMGPFERPTGALWAHGLFEHGKLVAVTAASILIKEYERPLCGVRVTRDTAFELARVCAERSDLCRAMLRLWREMVFPAICRSRGYEWAISYQDACLHTGDLYRFDGWSKLGRSRSGMDARSGVQGRDKVVWGWHADPEERRRAKRASESATVTTAEAA